MPHNITKSGFSLVELSVVLSVIGILLSGALTLATSKTEANRITETEEQFALIQKALEEFLTQNQRLPCPASGSQVKSNANYGKEGTPSSTQCASSNFNSGNAYAGVAPVKTLNLPDEALLDGWGNRITYIVDFRFANNPTTNGDCDELNENCFRFITDGSIRINDSTGAARTTTAVYTLISHGKNGNGAWKNIGSATRMPASTDSDEQSNAGNDAGSFDNIFVQKDATTAFDDIVSYKQKWQIIDEANGITDTDLCDAAFFQVNNPGNANATCTGITSETICRNMATAVDNLCFTP